MTNKKSSKPSQPISRHRDPMLPGTVVEFASDRAIVVSDDGGEVFKVKYLGTDVVDDWHWRVDLQTCLIISRPDEQVTPDKSAMPLIQAARSAANEMWEIVEFANSEKAPLRAQEIKSILRCIANLERSIGAVTFELVQLELMGAKVKADLAKLHSDDYVKEVLAARDRKFIEESGERFDVAGAVREVAASEPSGTKKIRIR